MSIHVPMWLVWVVSAAVAVPLAVALLFWLDDARRVWEDHHAKTPAWRIALALSLVGFVSACAVAMASAGKFRGTPGLDLAATTLAVASAASAATGSVLFAVSAARSKFSRTT